MTAIAVITGTISPRQLRHMLTASSLDRRGCQIYGRDPRRDFGSGPVEAYRLACWLPLNHAGDHADALDAISWRIAE